MSIGYFHADQSSTLVVALENQVLKIYESHYTDDSVTS